MGKEILTCIVYRHYSDEHKYFVEYEFSANSKDSSDNYDPYTFDSGRIEANGWVLVEYERVQKRIYEYRFERNVD